VLLLKIKLRNLGRKRKTKAISDISSSKTNYASGTPSPSAAKLIAENQISLKI